MVYIAGLPELQSYPYTLCVHDTGLAGLIKLSALVQAQSSDGSDQAEAPVGEALELIIDAPSGAATASQQLIPAAQ